MKVRIEKDKQGIISIFDSKGELLREFKLKDDLQKTLYLLKQVNSLKTEKGVSIFATRMIGDISAWSFSQSPLFWNLLWNSVKYEEIKKFLYERGIEEVIIKQRGLRLGGYLRMSGIKIHGNFNWRSSLKTLFIFFVKLIAWIISCLAVIKAVISRTPFLVYTPDKFIKKYGCDFRFFHTYKYLREKRVKFLETFHTLLGKEFFKNLFLRRKLVIYLESFPLFFVNWRKYSDSYDLSIFEPYERQYIKNALKYIDKEVNRSVMRIKILSKLLKLTQLKSLLAIDDTRSANELVAACKLNKIKTYGFQHGLFSKYNIGQINYGIPKNVSVYFDKLFVWNDYSRKVLLDYSSQYDESNTMSIEGIKEPSVISYKKGELKLPLKILIPYESFAPKREIGVYLNKLLDLGCELYFKPRPDVSVDNQFKEYHLQSFGGIKIIKNIDADILSKIDIAIGTYTGFFIEMIFYDKPILFFNTSFDLGHRFVEDGLAMLLKKDFTLDEIIDYIKNYKSKKEIAWPKTETTLEEVLDKILE